MEQSASTSGYPIITFQDQDHMTPRHTHVSPNSFDAWGTPELPSTAHTQMDWLASDDTQFIELEPVYPVSMTSSQTFFSNYSSDMAQQQGFVPRSHPDAQKAPNPILPSQTSSYSTSIDQAYSSHNSLMPAYNDAIARPQSSSTRTGSCGSVSKQSSRNSSPLSHNSRFKPPTIQTSFEDQYRSTMFSGTPLTDGIQVASDTDDMTSWSSEWMQGHGNVGQQTVYDYSSSAVDTKDSSQLLPPFQWRPADAASIGRRESMSSAASGSMFSPRGTPTSNPWQQSTFNSPYMYQHGWSARANRIHHSGSPQSPRYQRAATGHSSLRSNKQYLDVIQAKNPNSLSLPNLPNRKPRIGRVASDSYVSAQSFASRDHRAYSTDGKSRMPAETSLAKQITLPDFSKDAFINSLNFPSAELGHPTQMSAQTPSQVPLPPSLTSTPQSSYQFATPRQLQSSTFNTPHQQSSYSHIRAKPAPSTPDVRLNGMIGSTAPYIRTPAHQPPLPMPSDPPHSDTSPSQASPGSGPIRQSPQFEGDIYTARYKRRNADKKWEGWCGYCQPGRWLDLKNSRYWEDKLRNHGICARTKTFFDGPTRIRWINDRGSVICEGEPENVGLDCPESEENDDEGAGKKREGKCGKCHEWVPMDGLRSRNGKGKCTSWWTHAYKCHEQNKSKNSGIRT